MDRGDHATLPSKAGALYPHALATRCRNESTAPCSVPACEDSALVASSTADAERLVSSMAPDTVVMLPARSLAPFAACWMLRAISSVEALCSTTALAIVVVK